MGDPTRMDPVGRAIAAEMNGKDQHPAEQWYIKTETGPGQVTDVPVEVATFHRILNLERYMAFVVQRLDAVVIELRGLRGVEVFPGAAGGDSGSTSSPP